MRSLMAAKWDIFLRGLNDLPPIFHSRKNTQVLAGCAQTPTLFPPALLHQVHHLNTAQLSTLSTIILPQQNVCLCLVCVFPDFPLLGVNGFLFAVGRFGVYQETPSLRRSF